MLAMEGISKRFPGVLANDDVDLEVAAGEVHALLGENGAGKTTLMNILYGLYRPDAGTLRIDGEPVQLSSPRDAMARGVGLVAQHFHLARRHTVAENIALGLPGVAQLFPTRRIVAQISEMAERYQLAVDPNARIWQLSPGEQQRVEILKALLGGARLLILDEPTSVLTPQEAGSLFAVLEQMRSEGKAIIFISHKLDEVMRIADRVTVLRKGAVAGRTSVSDATPGGLARLMMGRDVPPLRSKQGPPGEEAMVVLDDVWVKNDRGVDALHGVSFEVRSGEILGVAGVAGNGQGELIEVLTGMRQPGRGHILLQGVDITPLGVRGLFEAGVAHIPEDRNHMGVVPSMSVAENLVLRQYRYPPFARGALLDRGEVVRFADRSIERYQVATPGRDTPTRLLSGGNVQKVILARELAGDPRLVVASHPTYGLDVSAAGLTHELLLEQRERGAGVLLVSEDLEELFMLSDRIAVLFAGRVMGIVDATEVDRDLIGLMMAGVAMESAA
jgi:simple sugar transport system ATP-binding protein